jgi:hypothetical protein
MARKLLISLGRYLETGTLAAKKTHLKEKLAKLASELQRLKAIETEMRAAPDQQISLTDPDLLRCRRAGAARGRLQCAGRGGYGASSGRNDRHLPSTDRQNPACRSGHRPRARGHRLWKRHVALLAR